MFKLFKRLFSPTITKKYYFNNRRVSEAEWVQLAQDDFDKAMQHMDNIAKRMQDV